MWVDFSARRTKPDVISTKGEARTEKSGYGRDTPIVREQIPPLQPAFGRPPVGMALMGATWELSYKREVHAGEGTAREPALRFHAGTL